MGDRSHLEVTVHAEDAARFAEIVFRCKLEEIEPDGYVVTGGKCRDGSWVFEDEQADGGGLLELEEAAGEGLRFYGWSGAGCQYDGARFASTGDGELHTVADGIDGGPYVSCDPETGEPDPEGLKRVKAWARANAALTFGRVER